MTETVAPPTADEIARARAMIAAEDARLAAEQEAANRAAIEARAALYGRLRDITQSPAYTEVMERITAIAPEFMVGTGHVPYLANALQQVADIAVRG